jgi:hypothetical protein
MKRKYLTVQVLLACLSRPAPKREDIHVQLAMTIAKRKKVILDWKQSFFGSEKDIHALLAETIAERELILRQWQGAYLEGDREDFEFEERNAA